MEKVTHSMSYYTNRINTLIDKVLEIDNSNSDVVKQCESIKKNSSEIMDVFTNGGRGYHKDVCKIVLKMVKQVDNLLIDYRTNAKQSKIINKIYPHLDGLLSKTAAGSDEYAYLKTKLDTLVSVDKVLFGEDNSTENSIYYIFSKLVDLNLVKPSVLNLDKHGRYYWDINEITIPSYKKHILARLLSAITDCAYNSDTGMHDFGWNFKNVIDALITDRGVIINAIKYSHIFDYDTIAVKFYNEYSIMTELD